ncbi:membrane-associated transporter protein [Caerostris extrusa]|uniref:Membrane-associated transporter protein n=1 Tax=Caerostris extrusa TaxID=172846 RepID=A0AAV4VIS8_CAEEX|nr:membrane-associated transporter protein [Caerostris extrusa]
MYKEYREKLQVGNRPNIKELDVLEQKPPPVYGTTAENNGLADVAEDETSISKPSFENFPSPQSDKVETEKDGKIQEIDIASELGIANEHPGVKDFLKSLVHMPKSLKIQQKRLVRQRMSLVYYSLYFTDFVAECVFGGDPQAPEDSESYKLYKEGVQFGCWGMALYSLSCAIYSYFIEALVKKIVSPKTLWTE